MNKKMKAMGFITVPSVLPESEWVHTAPPAWFDEDEWYSYVDEFGEEIEVNFSELYSEYEDDEWDETPYRVSDPLGDTLKEWYAEAVLLGSPAGYLSLLRWLADLDEEV